MQTFLFHLPIEKYFIWRRINILINTLNLFYFFLCHYLIIFSFRNLRNDLTLLISLFNWYCICNLPCNRVFLFNLLLLFLNMYVKHLPTNVSNLRFDFLFKCLNLLLFFQFNLLLDLRLIKIKGLSLRHVWPIML